MGDQNQTEDQRKIHAEINQIVNQRFLLTTVAVTIFGAFAALAVPKQGCVPFAGATDPSLSLSYTAAILMLFVFSLLYFASFSLRSHLRVLTTYLAVSKLSVWEKHWEKYRENGHFAYTKTQALFFAALGFLVAVFPFVIEWQILGNLNCRWEHVAVAVLFVFYETFVLVAGFFPSTSAERKYRDQWQKVIGSVPSAQDAQ